MDLAESGGGGGDDDSGRVAGGKAGGAGRGGGVERGRGERGAGESEVWEGRVDAEEGRCEGRDAGKEGERDVVGSSCAWSLFVERRIRSVALLAHQSTEPATLSIRETGFL